MVSYRRALDRPAFFVIKILPFVIKILLLRAGCFCARAYFIYLSKIKLIINRIHNDA